MRYTVTREIEVEASSHGEAVDFADELWSRNDHEQLARHASRHTVEPVKP